MICIACGQVIPSGKRRRICCLCYQPILATHKYRLNDNSQTQHKCCEFPEYASREAKEAVVNREMPLFDEVAT